MPESNEFTGVTGAVSLPSGELLVEPDLSSILRRFPGASLLEVTPEQAAALEAPFPDDEIEILPTGEPYVPNGRYRARLNQVFGHGRWALLPDGPYVMDGTSVVQLWVLVVKGHVASIAPGSGAAGHDPDLAQQLESAKSNALTRVCKDFGIGLFLAQKRWAETFRDRHCMQLDAKAKQRDDWRRCWRRVDGIPFNYEGTIHRQPGAKPGASPAPAASQAPAAAPDTPEERPGKARTAKEREEEFFAEMANERKRVGNALYLKVLEKFVVAIHVGLRQALRAAGVAEEVGLTRPAPRLRKVA